MNTIVKYPRDYENFLRTWCVNIKCHKLCTGIEFKNFCLSSFRPLPKIAHTNSRKNLRRNLR